MTILILLGIALALFGGGSVLWHCRWNAVAYTVGAWVQFGSVAALSETVIARILQGDFEWLSLYFASISNRFHGRRLRYGEMLSALTAGVAEGRDSVRVGDGRGRGGACRHRRPATNPGGPVDGNYRPYDYLESSERIKEILNQPSGAYQEVPGLPDLYELSFTNGFYGTCSALFIDIRSSSALTEKYKRPTLAKIYRAFISEMVALLNSDLYVREVNIVGDCVWAVYNTPLQSHIDDVFAIAFQANTLKELLNHHFEKKGIDPIGIGIGAEWGRALIIKAGYSGSGIDEVVYRGDVVNRAAHLAHEAGHPSRDPVYVGSDFQGNLNAHNRGLLTSQYVQGLGTVYTGNVVREDMDEWIGALR